MGRRISDGKAVKCTVPISTTIVAGNFYELDGFVGMAMEALVTDGSTTSEVTLEVALYEYETSQITVADAFDKGDDVFWDATTDLFTTDDNAGANRFFGRVTSPKDGDDVVWIKREQ